MTSDTAQTETARPEPGSGEAVTDETLGSHNSVVQPNRVWQGRGGWRIVSDQLREPNSGTVWMVYPPGAQKPSHLAFTEEDARWIVRGGDTPADETLEELERLEQAASPAPWPRDGWDSEPYFPPIRFWACGPESDTREQAIADQTFLKAIRETAPALLAEVRRIRRENRVGVHVPLTDREQQALNELAQMQELSPARVMLQALRLYQLVTVGGAEVVWPLEEREIQCAGGWCGRREGDKRKTDGDIEVKTVQQGH